MALHTRQIVAEQRNMKTGHLDTKVGLGEWMGSKKSACLESESSMNLSVRWASSCLKLVITELLNPSPTCLTMSRISATPCVSNSSLSSTIFRMAVWKRYSRCSFSYVMVLLVCYSRLFVAFKNSWYASLMLFFISSSFSSAPSLICLMKVRF